MWTVRKKKSIKTQDFGKNMLQLQNTFDQQGNHQCSSRQQVIRFTVEERHPMTVVQRLQTESVEDFFNKNCESNEGSLTNNSVQPPSTGKTIKKTEKNTQIHLPCCIKNTKIRETKLSNSMLNLTHLNLVMVLTEHDQKKVNPQQHKTHRLLFDNCLLALNPYKGNIIRKYYQGRYQEWSFTHEKYQQPNRESRLERARY